MAHNNSRDYPSARSNDPPLSYHLFFKSVTFLFDKRSGESFFFSFLTRFLTITPHPSPFSLDFASSSY